MSDGESKKIDSAQFAEFLKDVLPGGAVVPLKVTGSSMRQFLYSRRAVLLKRAILCSICGTADGAFCTVCAK